MDSKFSTPSVWLFISAPEKTVVKQDANEIIEREGRASQLVNLDTAPFVDQTPRWGAKTRSRLPAALSLLLPVSTGGLTRLSRPFLVSHPVTCVIDRYIYVHVR